MGDGKCFLSRPYCIFFTERKICVSWSFLYASSWSDSENSLDVFHFKACFCILFLLFLETSLKFSIHLLLQIICFSHHTVKLK